MNSKTKEKVMIQRVALLSCLLIIAFRSSLPCRAAEITFPTPAYEAAELQKVKDWEKIWAGKKISTENVDQVKEFLHEAVYMAMKDPAIFGAKSIWFDIVP